MMQVVKFLVWLGEIVIVELLVDEIGQSKWNKIESCDINDNRLRF